MTVERHLLSRKFSPHHGEEIEKKSAFVKKREENSNQAHIGTCIKFSHGDGKIYTFFKTVIAQSSV